MHIYTGMTRLAGNHHGQWENGSGETLRSTVRIFQLGKQRYGRTSWGLRFYIYWADGSNISFDIGVRFQKPPFPQRT